MQGGRAGDDAGELGAQQGMIHLREEVLEIYEVLKKNQYGQYLKDVLDGKYIDAIGENR